MRVYLDHDPVEILRYGETLRREIAPGPHKLKAHNTLSSDTIHFDAAPGEKIRVRCLNQIAKGGVISMLTIGFAYISVKLEIVDKPAE